MKLQRLSVLLLPAAALHASYQYYLTDNLTATTPSNWITVGSPAPGSGGLTTAGGGTGGSLISSIPIPDGSAEAEVRITIRLSASGGVYTEYLQASASATTAAQGAGTYFAFEMRNPQFDSSGHCTADFLLLQSAAGSISALANFQ